MRMPKTVIALATALIGMSASAIAQVSATARFIPEKIFIDETATYEIVINGSRSVAQFSPPEVAGLSYISTSRRSNMSFINGRMSSNVTFSFGVRASDPGTYTIESFNVGGVDIPAATLEVVPMSEERQKLLEERQRQQREAQKQLLGMELRLPEGPFYVGQAVPIQISSYLRNDLGGEPIAQPQKQGDEFTIAPFPERPVVENQPPYRRFHWPNVLTPVKAGKFQITFTEPFIVGRTIFNQQQVELSTEPVSIDVQPLPNAGRPPDFTGAIGDFSVNKPTLDADRMQVGEPVTLRVEVKGEGNFDRMSAPVLAEDAGWRSYPPEESFEASNAFGNQGSKIFNYVLIPRSETITETPSLTFSFFKPEAGEYAELNIAGLPVTVLPAPPGSEPRFELKPKTVAPRGPELLPIKDGLGYTTSTLQPLFYRPAFWIVQLVLLAVVLAVYFKRKRHLRLMNDPDYARSLKARRALQKAMDAAVAAANKKDADAFYAAAQNAIQQACSSSLKREAESLTLLEIQNHMQNRGISPEISQSVSTIFEARDALHFGGLRSGSVDYESELGQLRKAIAVIQGGER